MRLCTRALTHDRTRHRPPVDKMATTVIKLPCLNPKQNSRVSHRVESTIASYDCRFFRRAVASLPVTSHETTVGTDGLTAEVDCAR